MLSTQSRRISGIILITVPSIIYGGLSLLGLLSNGQFGVGGASLELTDTQWALWRAGHAHAGVLVILSLVIIVLTDDCRLPTLWNYIAKLGTLLAAILISAGFFGIAFIPELKWLLYAGVVSLISALLLSGIALLRPPPS